MRSNLNVHSVTSERYFRVICVLGDELGSLRGTVCDGSRDNGLPRWSSNGLVASTAMTLTAVVSMVGLQRKHAGRQQWGVLPNVVKNGDEGRHQRSNRTIHRPRIYVSSVLYL